MEFCLKIVRNSQTHFNKSWKSFNASIEKSTKRKVNVMTTVNDNAISSQQWTKKPKQNWSTKLINKSVDCVQLQQCILIMITRTSLSKNITFYINCSKWRPPILEHIRTLFTKFAMTDLHTAGVMTLMDWMIVFFKSSRFSGLSA